MQIVEGVRHCVRAVEEGQDPLPSFPSSSFPPSVPYGGFEPRAALAASPAPLSVGCGLLLLSLVALPLQMYEIKSQGSIAKTFSKILHKLSAPLKPRVPEHSNSRMKNLSYPFSREKMYLWVAGAVGGQAVKQPSRYNHPSIIERKPRFRVRPRSRCLKWLNWDWHVDFLAGCSFALCVLPSLGPLSTSAWTSDLPPPAHLHHSSSGFLQDQFLTPNENTLSISWVFIAMVYKRSHSTLH